MTVRSVRTRRDSPHGAHVAALLAGGFALTPAFADAQGETHEGSAAPSDTVPIRVDYSAPAGCPSARDFLVEVSARTVRARAAIEGEAARIFRVAIQAEGIGAIGRMVVERDGETSAARVIRGKSCSEVSSALALTAALSIDPAARLSLEPAPALNPVAPVASEPVPPPSPAPALPREPWRLGTSVGAGAGFAQIVAPGVMPVASLFGELLWSHGGAAGPAVRFSVNAASSGLDAGEDAIFTWVAGGLELCPLTAHLGGPLELRPCAAGQGGLLRGRGRNIALPLSASRPWWTAGASVHLEARLSSRFGLELSGNALVPFRPLELELAAPTREIARTPELSVGVGLGAIVRLP